MRNKNNPAIIIGGKAIALSGIRSLGKRGIPIVYLYYDVLDVAAKSKYVTQKMFVPDAENSQKEFIDTLIKNSKNFGNGVIFPCTDEALIAVSKFKKQLEKFYTIISADWEVVQKIIEKKNTYDCAENIGVPYPKTFLPQSREDVSKYADQVSFPCLVKPSQGHQFENNLGKKMTMANNKNELLEGYDEAVGMRYEVIIQEFIKGKDKNNASYFSYKVGNEFYLESTARKVRNDPPETGSPRVSVTEHIPEIISSSRKILTELNFEGYSCVEFKEDPIDNSFKLMEINGRLNLSLQQLITAGIDYPWLIYNHRINGEIPGKQQCKEGIYWIDITRDITRSIQFHKKEKYSLIEYIKPYLSKHVFAIFSFRDPLPFIQRVINLFKKHILHFH